VYAVADLQRSKRSSAWGPPESRGPPSFKKRLQITITQNAFNTIIDIVGVGSVEKKFEKKAAE